MESDKLSVLLSHPFRNEDPGRQIPGADDIAWAINRVAGEHDIWIVHEDIGEQRQTATARAVVLITTEPPLQRTYPSDFLRQFDLVVTCHPQRRGVRQLMWQQCYPWHVGWSRAQAAASDCPARSYKALVAAAAPEKVRRLSVVCSMESRLPGHQLRLKFVKALKSVLGDELAWYGRGINPVDDKWDALAPYHYHLCLENSRLDHYWTEKVADAFLAGCLPIYWGAPNLSSYFDPAGFEEIDFSNQRQAIERVCEIIKRIPTRRQLAAIAENRHRVMHGYSYDGLARALDRRFRAVPRRTIALSGMQTYRHFGHLLLEKIRRVPSRIRHEISSTV